jgi:LmbE family N-acetylglucosaminyl deacetylase
MLKICVVIAHPDDETMLSGGVLALLARGGVEVHYLCATRGEGGEMGEPPLCTRTELGEVREQEMRCAVQTLGGASVEFLDYVDPTVGENDELHPYTDDVNGLVTKILAHIQRVEPDAVITHGSSGEYGHPAHLLTHQAVRQAVRQMNDQTLMLYTFSAAFPKHPRPRLTNEGDPAHLVCDIAPVLQQKIDAALCHKTQNALFVRRSSRRAGRQLEVADVIMKVEGLHRACPSVNGKLDDAVIEILKPWAVELNEKP